MKVALRDIPCQRHVEADAAFVAEAVSGLPIRAALERPAEDPGAGHAAADLDLYMDDENVFVRGPVSGWVEVACSRCIGPVKVPIEEDLFVTFMPAARMPVDDADDSAGPDGDDDEVEAAEDDVDLYPYQGEEIDLAPLLREQVILSVPFAPLCTEDCKGLCPVCGTDLNTGSCTCDRTPVDPRWSALKNLKS